MTKEGSPYCFIIQSGHLTQSILLGNQILQVKKGSKKGVKGKLIATLPKDLEFSINKTEILQNKKYKFYLQLKIKINQTLSIIVDGKDDLQYFIKHLSEFGMARGLQEMIVSCEKVGEGSFAEVYKVITNYDTTMALKSFDKKNLKIAKNKLAFQNQIDVMKLLKNKYIISLDGLFQTDKNIYVKMQYLSISLKHYIKKNVSIKIQKKIMKQLFQALLEMKNKNIIHRDLKPQNIMIRGKNQKNMECVIIDFGLATPVNVEKYIFNRCGTPGFLAPQIAKMSNKKEKLTPACDIFSLGCIFYKILSKKYIFAAPNYNQVIQKNKNVCIPWQTLQQLAQNEKDLLKKMLEKDPLKRITPQQALKHPYFNQQIDDQDQIPLQQCDLIKKMRVFQSSMNVLNRKHSTQSMMQSFHSNSQASFADKQSISSLVEKKKFQIKDSCLSFQGPIKGSHAEKDSQFGQNLQKSTYNKKRVSRFSQINQIPIL